MPELYMMFARKILFPVFFSEGTWGCKCTLHVPVSPTPIMNTYGCDEVLIELHFAHAMINVITSIQRPSFLAV